MLRLSVGNATLFSTVLGLPSAPPRFGVLKLLLDMGRDGPRLWALPPSPSSPDRDLRELLGRNSPSSPCPCPPEGLMLCLLVGLDPDLDRGGVSPIKPPFSLIAGRDEPLPTRSNTPEPSRAWSWWEDIPPHDQVRSSAGCVSTHSPFHLAGYPHHAVGVRRRLFPLTSTAGPSSQLPFFCTEKR
jgi:hypothetical protein